MSIRRVGRAVLITALTLAANSVRGESISPEELSSALEAAHWEQLPSVGNPDAPVVVLEFADFQCPYCRQHARTTEQEIFRKYVRTGEVKYVFAHFPLPEHPEANLLAAAAQCAGREGKFWEMHDLLFALQEPVTVPALEHGAAELSLSPVWKSCLHESRTRAIIRSSHRLGERLGVQGTPWFVMGAVHAGHWSRITPLFGARPMEEFERRLDALLHEDP